MGHKPNVSKVWSYYRVRLKLTTPQLGTCTSSSIWRDHVLAKSKKLIAEANQLTKRMKKALEKYEGDAIRQDKEDAEVRALIRTYQEKMNRIEEVPAEREEMLRYAERLDVEYLAYIESGEEAKSTVFMRDPSDGWPVISSHMIVGNLKENLKIVVNNNVKKRGDVPGLKSKVSVNEMIRLDLRPVEEFIRPSMDVAKDEHGRPRIMERPIRFEDNFGKTKTAIALSEYLPAGAEYEFHIRVRNDSPWNDEEQLQMFFDYGEGNGLGQNRGSGYGQYLAKVEKVNYDPSNRPDGW